MQVLVLASFVAVLFSQYASENWLPGFFKLTPELLSAIVAVYVILEGMRQRFRYIQAKYWVLFGALLLSVTCGLVANSVDAGPIVTGMRMYGRTLPFFVLPFLHDFDEKQVKQQVRFLFLLGLIQIPFAVRERWILMSQGRFTGDLVYGSLGLENSGTLTLFLILCVSFVLGLLMRGRIKKAHAVALFFLLLIPTTINETKITVLLLPLVLLATLLFGSPRGQRLRIGLLATTLLVSFGAIFIPIYNIMQENNPYPQKISLALLTDNRANYLEAKNAGVGSTTLVGRGDALKIPLAYITKDPVLTAFGLGVGNASTSSLGIKFYGKYGQLFENVAITSFATFILELGFLGILPVLAVHWFIFSDAIWLIKRDTTVMSSVAIAWTGVSVLVAVGLFYQKVHYSVTLSYLYWYFSGLIAARCARLNATATETSPSEEPVIDSNQQLQAV